MELKGFEWCIYTLIIVLSLIVLFFLILLTIKCLQTCIQTRTLCCIKRQSMNRAQANLNQDHISFSSSESESDDLNTELSTPRQSDNIHDNFAFITDYENSTPTAVIINRKYDDSTRYSNVINTISSCIDNNQCCSLNIENSVFSFQTEPDSSDLNKQIIIEDLSMMSNCSLSDEEMSIRIETSQDEIPPNYDTIITSNV